MRALTPADLQAPSVMDGGAQRPPMDSGPMYTLQGPPLVHAVTRAGKCPPGMLDSGVMFALAQLQAELQAQINKNSATIATLQNAFRSLRRVAGVFYDAGAEDERQRLKGKHRRPRHLRSVDD
jgi:hypothetical protein